LDRIRNKILVLTIIIRYSIKISYILRKNKRKKGKESKKKGQKRFLYIVITPRRLFFR
jgi:hypothetical protein